MNWQDVGKLVAPIAPIAGSILGGFLPIPGGSIIGQKFGELIAGAFGVAPTPQAVSDAITNAGRDESLAKINAATEQARIQIDGFVDLEKATLDAMVRNAADVNATMRAETAAPESLFYRGWRPFLGWSFGVIWTTFGLALTAITLREAYISQHPLQTLYEAWPLFLAYFGTGAAMVGVLIPSRSIEKKAAIENGVSMPNAKPVSPPTQPQIIPAPKISPRPIFIGKPPGSKD
jgi:hypothetical protein